MSFTQREARRIIRKAVARVPEGEEIRHLNIMPMMDMMTILLVAFIYQAAVSATQLTAGTVSLPKSLSDDELPEGASTVIITKTGIVVSAGKEAKSIVSVSNGDVDPAEKEGGATGIKIPRLTNFLAALHHEEDVIRQSQPGYDPAKAPAAELMIIADRTTPYRLLIEVLFSAKQKEAGYKRFRLIVQKSFPGSPSKP
ncbi:MAG: biopolymer transporter ExbD [Myxococcales bacterium]|nr:biopolymer transporter ExbD [Myxococcales bacterium]